ncbi:unnamed protein product [Echinostoma caproni]|uniref:Peptidase A2 domain-containing protein n=1 Tax=Echinostoma caproni TaxID=27848 RepID=A0A183AYE7_9TREM|nr:unnamed protein product [Echinostoma caproni]
MDRHLRPDRFDTDPNSPNGADSWEHWYYTFTNFLGPVEKHKPDKLKALMHFLPPTVYKFVSRCTDYDSAITTLQFLYIQTKNEIFACHLLATSRQSTIETLDQFMQKFRNLAQYCNFKAVSAKENEEDAICDAFISGLLSNPIRQRLFKNKTLDVSTAYDKVKALDLAQQQSQTFAQATPSIYAAACPAKNATCKSRGKRGHFQKVCLAPANSKHTAATPPFLIFSISAAAAPAGFTKAVTDETVNGLALKALVDTGSSGSYVSEEIVFRNKWSTLT